MDDLLVVSLDDEDGPLSEEERARFERPCDNCGRLALAEKDCMQTSDGGLYCGQNCFWSKALDKTNQRLRGGKKMRKRTKAAEEATDSPKFGQKAGLVNVSFNDSSNALFVYHAYFCGAYSLRTRRY